MNGDFSPPVGRPVEVPVDGKPNELARGFALGVAATAALAHLMLLSDVDGLRVAYDELHAAMPITARIALSLAWMWGVPIACAVAIAALVVKRPRSPVAYVAVAVVFAAALLATWHFPSAPLRELAGNIKP